MNGEIASLAAGGADALGLIDPYELLGACATSQVPGRWRRRRRHSSWSGLGSGRNQRTAASEQKTLGCSDPTWRDNPWYKRLAGAAYLAWCDTVDRLVETAEFDERERVRVRYATNALTALTARSTYYRAIPRH